jgi:hypothetical protein
LYNIGRGNQYQGEGASRRIEREKGMTEVVFLVEDDPEGGYTARALGESIFTQADDMATLRQKVLDAVRCHFSGGAERPKLVRLHQVRDEVLAL